MVTTDAEPQIASARFEFGENWRRFLAVLNEDRIRQAQRALCTMLECDSLRGLSFLDLGSGSGLSSLAAHGSVPSVCTHSTLTREVSGAPSS